MNEAVETIEYKGFNIEVYQDENAESPRDGENFGTMVCSHKKYTLGDKNSISFGDFNSWEEVENYIVNELKAMIIMPLYLYDHSGISMKTFRHGQHSSWDCGQVGFIYATKEDILENLGAKKITKKLKERAEKIMVVEVETYNDYISGAVYSFAVVDSEGEHHDSGGGFYGYDNDKSGLLSEAKRQVDYIVKEEKKLQLQY